MVTISEVAEVNPSFPRTSNIASESLASFLPMAAVSESGIITVQDERPFAEVSKGYTYFANGDVLMAKITPCMENGKATFVQNLTHPAGFGSTEFHVLRPGSKVDGKYLFYMIWNPMFRKVAERYMTGTAGQKRVPSSFLKDFKIPLPPLPEQKRIAAILDKADSIRRKRQESVRLTEELLRSVFLDMFGDPVTNPKGWKVSNVQDLCKVIVDCPHTTPKYEGENRIYPCIRTSDLQRGFLDYSTTRYVDEEEYRERIARHQPIAGDILYSREGERFGIAAMVEEEINPCLGQRMMLLQAIPAKTTPAFLWGLMNSKAIYHQATCLVGGATSPHVNVGDIKKLKAIMPPLALQTKFSSIVKSVFSVRQRQFLSKDSGDKLFSCFMQLAFKGTL